ncbi:MAG: glucokinase, partial [Gammaproteobacteria bacterium]
GDLAPGTPLEAEIVLHLQANHGHACWETVLSGPGLVRLYRAAAAVLDVAPETEATPEWITAEGVAAASGLCRQTLELFCGWLGAAAGNLAVTVCARGGVYLAGGILPQLADVLPQTALRQRFETRGDLTAFVREMPLWLVKDPEPGLIGAAACLADT